MSGSRCTVVCVGAHPDDVEIGMGGTIALLVDAGHRVVIVDLTDGEPTPFGSRERRLSEATEAARILGAERVTLDLRNRHLADTEEARVTLAAVLREVRPQVVFGPYPVDAHPDHVAAAHIVRSARFFAKLSKTSIPGEPFHPARVVHYLAMHERRVIEPTLIVDVTATFARKLDALRAYRTQFADNPANVTLLDEVEAVGRFWGVLGRTGAGEPFVTTEPLVARSLAILTG